MHCLLDKSVVRRGLKGLVGGTLTEDVRHSLRMLTTFAPGELYISLQMLHILTHIVREWSLNCPHPTIAHVFRPSEGLTRSPSLLTREASEWILSRASWDSSLHPPSCPGISSETPRLPPPAPFGKLSLSCGQPVLWPGTGAQGASSRPPAGSFDRLRTSLRLQAPS
jgi:hypothetical protein